MGSVWTTYWVAPLSAHPIPRNKAAPPTAHVSRGVLLYIAFALRDEDFTASFLTEFQDRCCFGSDFCGLNMPMDMVPLLLCWRESGKLSETVFQKIARENTIRLLNL